MEKEVCFCVENKNLYLEQVLVDYMGVPIFFLCKNEKQYYVVLCTDMDELNYIIVKATSIKIYDLLHGKLPMRDIFLNQKEYWEVISGEEMSSDLVVRHKIKQMNPSLLPETNACFKILTEELRAFVQKFDNEFLSTEYIKMSEGTITLVDYSFKMQSKRQAVVIVRLEGEYIPHVRKSVMLQKSMKPESWKMDYAIGAAV